MVRAVINNTGGTKATINSNNGNAPQQVSVTLPSGSSAGSIQKLSSLSDVDVSSVADGALLQYNGSTQKFTAKNELDTTTGTLVFNGGSF
tara:strand:+ start:3179 stop:3448 length:270 start_codon:yes stop_codon:yes gene_type:complete